MADLEPAELGDLLQAAQRSQAWLARQLGIRAETISHWMHGSWPIPQSRHDRIRSLLTPEVVLSSEDIVRLRSGASVERGGVSVSYESKGKN
jgi:hypothetical protein